tara:strand:+ start:1912 stop:2358 length:447 start_codon:yes stop_codon:yes gene_type:complete
MAITFTWSVKDMHKVTETGAVYRVDWACVGVDADTEVSHSRSGSYLHTASITSQEIVNYEQRNVIDSDGDVVEYEQIPILEDVTRVTSATPDHTASGFTPYADLTEADVLAWCKADGVGAKTEASITSNITNKIEAQANSTGMPWAAE